jgi:hypothetical protein
MTDVVTAIGTTGFLVIGTSALDGSASATTGVLAKFTLPNPAGTVSGDILTLDFDPDISATASAGGTAAKAEIWSQATPTGASHVIVSGLTVGTGSENVVLSTVTIGSGATVTIATGTLTHATT